MRVRRAKPTKPSNINPRVVVASNAPATTPVLLLPLELLELEEDELLELEDDELELEEDELDDELELDEELVRPLLELEELELEEDELELEPAVPSLTVMSDLPAL